MGPNAKDPIFITEVVFKVTDRGVSLLGPRSGGGVLQKASKKSDMPSAGSAKRRGGEIAKRRRWRKSPVLITDTGD